MLTRTTVDNVSRSPSCGGHLAADHKLPLTVQGSCPNAKSVGGEKAIKPTLYLGWS